MNRKQRRVAKAQERKITVAANRLKFEKRRTPELEVLRHEQQTHVVGIEPT